MKIKLLLTCTVVCGVLFLSFGQVTVANLEGEWAAINTDSSYYKLDDIEFHQENNYYIKAKKCDFVIWTISDSLELQIENHFVCTEPGRVVRLSEEKKIKIISKRKSEEIQVLKAGIVIERFTIVSYDEIKIENYPYDVKVLKLRRIKSVCSEVYKVTSIPKNAKKTIGDFYDTRFSMADTDEKFQATDVVSGRTLKERRLIFWALCGETGYLVYEHGGYGYHKHLIVFSVKGKSYLVEKNIGVDKAKTLDEIKELLKADKDSIEHF